MERRDFLRAGVVTTALVLGVSNLGARGLESAVNQSGQEREISKEKRLSVSELIKAVTLEDSFGFVESCKNNTPFKQQIAEYGFNKTVEHLARMKYFSIDLANKYSQCSKEIPMKEYLIASRQIGLMQVNFKKGHTNPLDEKVILTRAKTLEIATEGHRRILSRTNVTYENKNVQQQYFDLVRRDFTEIEYTKYCEQMADAMDKYYDALADSLGWKKILGQGNIGKMKKVSREGYFGVRDKIYFKLKGN